jgi:hypothetical protein
LVPLDAASAESFVGQNLAVHIRIGRNVGRQWIVPAAAVVTQADGRAIVNVMRKHRQHAIPVRTGFSYLGHEVVNPVGAEFRRGDEVIIGHGSS